MRGTDLKQGTAPVYESNNHNNHHYSYIESPMLPEILETAA